MSLRSLLINLMHPYRIKVFKKPKLLNVSADGGKKKHHLI